MDIKADIQNDLHIPKNERLELSTNVNQERMGNNPVVFNHSHINEIFKLS
jgi:5-formaminoimidazole-4-carboxamide-1-beta-D-ribofuranosyl 5'-monophosphate synthetase